MLHSAAVPIEPSKEPPQKEQPPAVPEEFMALIGQSDEALSSFAAGLSDADLARFQRVSRRFYVIGHAEFETRASYLWKYGEIIPETFHAHEDIAEVFVTKDGNIVSVGLTDRNIYVWKWDGETYKQIKHIVDDVNSNLADAKFSLASNRLVLQHLDDTVSIWDIQAGNKLNQFTFGNVFRVEISPDGSKLAVTHNSKDGIIEFLDVDKGGLFKRIFTGIKRINTGYHEIIWSIAFSPDGKKLASAATKNNPVKIWNVKTYMKEETFPFDKTFPFLSFLPDGKLIAHPDAYPISFWDVQTGVQISSLKYPDRLLRNIRLSHGFLLAIDWQDKIGIYHIQSGKIVRELKIPCISTLAFSPNDKMLVAGGWNGDIFTWKIKLPAKST